MGTTNSVLTDLYALRAGLSMISRENDLCNREIDTATQKKESAIQAANASKESKIAQAKAKTRRAKARMEDCEYDVQKNTDNKVEEYKRKIEESKQRYEENSAQAIKAKKTLTSDIVYFWLHVTVAVLLIVALGLYLTACIGTLRHACSPRWIGAACVAVFVLCGIDFLLEIDIGRLYPLIYGALLLLCVGIYAFLGHAGGVLMFTLLRVLLFFIGGLAAIGCVCFYVHESREECKDSRGSIGRWENWAEDARKEIERNTSAYEKEKERAEEQSEKRPQAEREYARAEKEYDDSRRESEQTKRQAETECAQAVRDAETICEQTCAAAKQTHGQVGAGVWQTLVELYADLLDTRDWKNVDLVIYYLETGRAESIKEALLLVDKERQNERIVQAVGTATQAIAQRLDDGFGNLQTQLNYSFHMLGEGLVQATQHLSAQIGQTAYAVQSLTQAQSEGMHSLLSGVQSLSGTVGERLDKLSSQGEMQQALLSKANTSGEKLMEDVRKIRSYIKQ